MSHSFWVVPRPGLHKSKAAAARDSVCLCTYYSDTLWPRNFEQDRSLSLAGAAEESELASQEWDAGPDQDQERSASTGA